MTRFLLMAMPFTGHVAPLAAIARALVDRGHDVRMYTGSAFRGTVEAAGARFLPWTSAPDFDERNLPATFPRLVGKKGLAQVLVNMEDLFIATAPAQLDDLRREWAREPWEVLVADEASVAPRMVADALGCRWATVAVLPLNLLSRQGPPSGLGMTPGRNPVTRARDAALRALAPTLSRPLLAAVQRVRADAGQPPIPGGYDEVVFSPQLVLASGVPSLDHLRTDRPPAVHWIGRLANPASSPPTPDWWGDLEGRRIVHVSQGTQNIDPEDLLRPALTALADLDVLVVAVTGVPGRTRLPFAVPANTRVADLVPYDLLLPRTAAMVTNGGWGGTLTALRYGVPLVIAGGDLDKPETAARVAAAGAGVNLRTGTPSSAAVGRAVRRVLGDPGYAERAARVGAELADAGGAPRAVELLEELSAR